MSREEAYTDMALKKSELYSSLWASCDELRGGMDASPGNASGKVRVADINLATTVALYPPFFTDVNGTLFFNATDGKSAYEVWKSNGNATCAVCVKDFRPGSGNTSLAYLTNVNGTLFFPANDGTRSVRRCGRAPAPLPPPFASERLTSATAA